MKKLKLFGISSAALMSASVITAGISPVVTTAADKKTEIVLWDAMNGPYAKAMETMVQAFNDSQSKYIVKVQHQGTYQTLNEKIIASAKSKTLPDLSQATYTQVPDLKKMGIITNLDPYMVNGKNKLSEKKLNNIYPGFLSSSKYEGHYYSVPLSKSVRIMDVNTALLKKYNLEIPKTWDDVDHIAQVLKKDGKFAVGFDKSFDMELEGMTKAAGTKFITSKEKVQFGSKTVVDAATKLYNMINNKEAWTAGVDIYGTKRFVEGNTALYFASSAGITATKEAAPEGFEWTTAVVPSYKGKIATELAGNDLVMLNNGKTNKAKSAGAWAFMKFMLQDKQTLNWATSTGYLPLTKTATKSETYKKYLSENPLAKAASQSLPYGFQSTAFLGYNDYRTEMTSAVDQVLTNNKAPKDVFPASAKKMKEIIKDAK
ncbi:MAG: extracellular solute-binding protein [Lactobacillaceae bacterium]|nr:extracellular solute-binding protein [Lactobacillaceae bacterium]